MANVDMGRYRSSSGKEMMGENYGYIEGINFRNIPVAFDQKA